MSATTTPTPPVASPLPDPQSPATRPSNAIRHGTDLLVNLIEDEKAKLTKLYHDTIKNLETNFKKKLDAELEVAKSRAVAQEKQIQELSLDLHRAQSRTVLAEAELEKLRAEHESLKTSLGDVGIVYIDRHLRFNEDTTRIVGDFIKGARIQQKTLMSSRLSSSNGVSSSEDDPLFKPVGPTEFFGVLSGVMEKGRKFAEELEKQRRREIKSPTNVNSVAIARHPPQLSADGGASNGQPPQTPAVLQPRPKNNHSDSTKSTGPDKLPAHPRALDCCSIETTQVNMIDS